MHVDVRKWWFFVSNHPFNHLHFWSWQNEFALIAQKGWTSIQPCFIVSSFLTTLSVIAFIEFTPSPSAAGALWAIFVKWLLYSYLVNMKKDALNVRTRYRYILGFHAMIFLMHTQINILKKNQIKHLAS